MNYNNSWSTTWGEAKPPNEQEQIIVKDAKDFYEQIENWEASARVNFDYDYKFANADTHNKYQWDNDLVISRELENKPCLTINKTQQHNLMIINDAKQNKPGIRIRPVGDEATFEGAQIFQELVYHIEYISSAENVYDDATKWQVDAGIGYWRVCTDYISDRSFDQEIYIKRVRDPRCVYLDNNINEVDGSDAAKAIIIEDMDKELFKKKHPKFANIVGNALNSSDDGWITKDTIKIAEYYCKEEREEKLVTWISPNNDKEQVLGFVSELNELDQEIYNQIIKDKRIKDLYKYQERKVITNNIKWYKIAGDRIIEKGDWLGKYIPIVRLIGTETVIDGILDRKGHTRALINAQQIYNYNTPLALDTPLPTPNGWTTMGEVKEGDWLFNEDGNPIQVFATSPILTNNKCYKIEFDDGTTIVADENHLWNVEECNRKRAPNRPDYWTMKTIPTKDINCKNHFIYLSKPLNLEEKQLEIHPYILGAWLGDGSTDANRIHSSFEDMYEMQEYITKCGYIAGECKIYSDKSAAEITVHGLRSQLLELNLLGNKHIPNKYLRASYEQRLNIIQGLMDTDGHISKLDQCVFINTNIKIVEGLKELLKTIGVKSTIVFVEGSSRKFPNGNVYDCKGFYRLQFSANPNIKIFKLRRKANKQNANRNYHIRRTTRYRIFSITEVPSVPVKCVTINSNSHLFLAGKGMIPTHNSANVEYGALQTKSPWVAPSAAIENFEQYYKTANTINHSYLPYNHIDEDGNPIPPPTRPAAPQASPAYVEQMKIAQAEMMMVSGQYQAQFGENENAKSGVAINARQRQGDRATYHFIDNQAIAIRFTGKILIDLIPKIYDTERIKKIIARDGTRMNVKIDPEMNGPPQDVTPPTPQIDAGQKIKEYIFNPAFGMYDIQADTGPSFATKRMETANALTQIAINDENFMKVGGDILFRSMDFPDADVLATRYNRMIDPAIKGEGPDPAIEQAMNDAANKIEQLSGIIAKLQQQVADKDKDLTIKAQALDLNLKRETAVQAREDYKAETDRMRDIFNTSKDGDGIDPELKKVLKQLIQGMIKNGELQYDDDNELGKHKEPDGDEDNLELPEGAKQAPDGNYYVTNEDGSYSRVEMQ
jgi:hypothetical protein